MSYSIIEQTYVALDLETTGLSPETDVIMEIGAVKFRNGQTIDTFQSLVNPHRTIPFNIQRLCHIYQADVKSAPDLSDIATDFKSFMEDFPVVGHNISFDMGFLQRVGICTRNQSFDTLSMTKMLLPQATDRSLASVIEYLGIPHSAAHRALADAQMAREVFVFLLQKLYEIDLVILSELARLSDKTTWLGDFLHQVAIERGANILLAEANLDKVCFSRKRSRPAESLSPAETRAYLDIQELTSFFDEGGPIGHALPDYEKRPQQIHMMRAVADALNSEEHLVVEAGTGTGKSIAYLIPSAIFALQNSTPVIVSTNTINLQEQLMHKDIPGMISAMAEREHLDGLKVVQLKGRTNYLCLRRWDIMRKAEGLPAEAIQLLTRILVWLPSTRTGDRSEIAIDSNESTYWNRVCAQPYDCLGKQCPYQHRGLCFLYRARKEAESAHLIVTNHALLLSEIGRGGQILPPYKHLVIDEAHHLEDVATSQLGVSIREKDIYDYLDQAFLEKEGLRSGIVPYIQYLAGTQGTHNSAEFNQLSKQLIGLVGKARKKVALLYTELGTLLQSMGQGQGEYDLSMRITPAVRALPAWTDVTGICEDLTDVLEDICTLLQKIDRDIDDLSVNETIRFQMTTLINLGQELKEQICAVVLRQDENSICWLTLGRKNNIITLHSAPLEVGPLLKSHLYLRLDTLVLTGATLTTNDNFNFIRSRLGLDGVQECHLDSPFDYQNASLIYLVDDIPQPGANGYYEALGHALVSLCGAAQGRSLILFTSYAALRLVKDAIGNKLMTQDILVLGHGIDGSPRKLLAFLQQNPRTVILGTSSFWEGIDVAGEALSVLGIVRLPFNVPSDPVFAARSETFRNPFNEYALPLAASKFKQGFGRLIRTKTDRGIMVVLDSRLSKKEYGKIFLKSLPSCGVEKGTIHNIPQAVQSWLGV